MKIDYEAEYNNAIRVPEHPTLIDGWVRDAAAYRELHPPRTLKYGPGPTEVIDFFAEDTSGPIVVFIHGGYWQFLERSSFSHYARGLNAHGVSVAIPGFDSCPAVTISQIIEQMRSALCALAKLGRPFVVCGHASGGHLAACMLATDWSAIDASLPSDLVVSAYAISGVFELSPLVDTSINQALRLDLASAKAASPLFWTPSRGKSLDAVVGEHESAEYLRQSRAIVDHWAEAGIATKFGIIPATNHFTSIAPLIDPVSPMVGRLRQLAGN